MGARDVKLGTVADALAWLRDAAAVTLSTPPGSPERARKLDDLARALGRAKQSAAEYRGKMADEIQLGVQAAEIIVRRMRGDGNASPDVTSDATPKKKRRHPRRLPGGDQ
jgi:hypothetical protein